MTFKKPKSTLGLVGVTLDRVDLGVAVLVAARALDIASTAAIACSGPTEKAQVSQDLPTKT